MSLAWKNPLVLNEIADGPGSRYVRDAAPTTSGVSEQTYRGRATELDAVVSEQVLEREPDLGLLRAYEPVIRYTKGELFFPTAVGPYVAQCSLWAAGPKADLSLIVPAGELTLERLSVEGMRHRDRALFLRFVEEPLGHAEYVRWRLLPRERLSASGRFTTSGLLGRLLDAGMRASLLLRGKVPAGLPPLLRPRIANGSSQTGSPTTEGWCETAAMSACSTGFSTP
jgi:hypothetical protein